MATYAIGDIQGCFYAFQALLEKLRFNPSHDRLWLVGDMINRGTGSLEMLRWCVTHEHAIQVVLGNHDLHAIAVAHNIRPPHRSDTLRPILEASDGMQLLEWLRHQPLIIVEDDITMVHAGLLPQWTINQAITYAAEVEAVLRRDDYVQFLQHMYGNQPVIWQDDLQGMDRLRLITNAFTRLRVCDVHGELDYSFKGELADIPAGFMPWFQVPNRLSQTSTIICGHWSALGLYQQHNIHALDTGCLWGGQLTAMCLETRAITQVNFDPRDKD
ncbi:MAG: symmetrical bis(5'-nucleosyl)-tetraphosphatase [Methylophilus sp.]|nr:symmetrical bis(5'-nucleosyl)-tetraphosphatase [Methylophilus sp.]MDP3608936.1 symmetrical bis(5'-nucleosyl)-tetraphosphatase [Methylophilus sp.]